MMPAALFSHTAPWMSLAPSITGPLYLKLPFPEVTKKVVSDVGAPGRSLVLREKEMEKPNGPYRRPSYSDEPGTEILQWPSSFLE